MKDFTLNKLLKSPKNFIQTCAYFSAILLQIQIQHGIFACFIRIMKKLASHIKPVAILLSFLIVFTITGKVMHLAFADCDHHISLKGVSDDELNITANDHEYMDCELCKFTPQTPTLVTTPQLETVEFAFVEIQVNTLISRLQIQSYFHDSSLRGPPSFS
ncbi:MAG: hypothetical protein ACPGJS_18700 [Flammeovirgaceae bacterium]